MAGPPINQGQQGKHIEGRYNYQPGRGVLTDPDPQALLDEFAGTGTPVNNVPAGQPGFRERVDFGRVTGNHVDQTTGKATLTTNGIIHYGKNGAHIVRSAP
jgi:filamentous hemagglutinin